MTDLTPIWALPMPELTESPNGPEQFTSLAERLELNEHGTVLFGQQGTLAARPPAGKANRRYLVAGDPNPRNNGREFIDGGTAWLEVNPPQAPYPGDLKTSLQAADHGPWLLANGRNNIPRAGLPADFIELMLLLGFPGVNVATIGVPDWRGRTFVGADPDGVTLPVTHPDLADIGGEEGHVLSVGELAAHHHGIAVQWGFPGGVNFQIKVMDAASGDEQEQFAGTRNTNNEGANNPHNNVQPFRAVNVFIFTGSVPAPGEGVGGGALLPRAAFDFSTANIADDAYETGEIELAPSVRLLRVETSVAARVRLYSTAADRDAAGEAARPGTTLPEGDHGVILDEETDVGGLSLRLLPQALGSNFDDPVTNAIYYRVTNLSGGASVVDVTIDWQALEEVV